MILFSTIYDKAINLIDDPTINRSYFMDKIRFQKIMNKYLVNGVDLLINPTSVYNALLDQSPPQGKLEIFDGSGSDTYALSTTPVDNSIFSFRIGKEVDDGAEYVPDTNSVKFSKIVPEGTKCSVEWYFCGAFNTDFSSCQTARTSAKYIENEVIGILSRATVLAWATKEKNFLLDIRNILNDSDFKLYSNANSLRAKKDWYDGIQKELDTMQNKLCWNLVSREFHGGRFYGR